MENQKFLTPHQAQAIQNQIFQSMPADKKLELGSELWRLAKELVGDKINHATHQPPGTPRRDR